MRINYDFTDLQVFLAVLDTGSFHVAGERIGLSQPAVTRRIGKLEEMLETRLFQRHTRMVRPTLAAKRLRTRAEAILAEAEEMTLAVRDESERYAQQRRRIVTIASIPTVIGSLIVPALRRFDAKKRGLRLRLLDRSAGEVAEAVAEGEADFGICSLPALDPVTSFTPLFDDPMIAVFPPRHPLGLRQSVTWADLSEEPVVLPRQGTGNRLLIDEAMAAARVTIKWAIEVGRSSTALEFVEAGLGVAILPHSALPDGSSATGRPVTAPEIRRPVGVLTRYGAQLSPLAAELQAAIAEAARHLTTLTDR